MKPYWILAVFLVSVLGQEHACPGDVPAVCHCKTDEKSFSAIHCDKCNLTDFSLVPTPTAHLFFQDNRFDVISDVPYGDSVTHLYLISNGIHTIADGAFAKLTNLKALSLSENKIGCIGKDTFRGLAKLVKLVLSDNPLYHLDVDTFYGEMLPQLTYLYLERCRLYEIEDKAFDSLSNLQILSLTHNHLRTVPAIGCPGTSLDNLLSWDMSFNEIETVPQSECHMLRVQHLYLPHNRIRTVNASFMGRALFNVRALHLSHNSLTKVDMNAFRLAQNLSQLDLSYNQLTTIDEEALNWDQLESVLIHDNPWECSCRNPWLRDKVSVAKYNDGETVRCGSPDLLYNQSVHLVDENVFKSCDSPPHRHRVAGVVIGVIFVIIALGFVSFVLYRYVRRRQKQPNPAIATLGPGPKASSVYRRMGHENDATFHFNDDRRPLPPQEMTSDPHFTIG